jgi:hypothetical protein
VTESDPRGVRIYSPFFAAWKPGLPRAESLPTAGRCCCARCIAGSSCWDGWQAALSTADSPLLVKHPLEEMLAQRVYGLALGYEDLNDHEQLRSDPLLAVLSGKRELKSRWPARAR